jgi:hypothetical protein
MAKRFKSMVLICRGCLANKQHKHILAFFTHFNLDLTLCDEPLLCIPYPLYSLPLLFCRVVVMEARRASNIHRKQFGYFPQLRNRKTFSKIRRISFEGGKAAGATINAHLLQWQTEMCACRG